jgi:CheY-like chemotaxis protein
MAEPTTVLLVEDDDQARELIRTILSQQGYLVLAAASGVEAVDIARKHPGRVDLLLSDMLLPEMSGYDTAQQVRSIHPDVPVLFISGYIEGDIVEKALADLNASFLDKPFSPSDLTTKIRSLVDGV